MSGRHLHISEFASKVLTTLGLATVFFFIIRLLYAIPELLGLLFAGILAALFFDGTATYLTQKTRLPHSWAFSLVVVFVSILTILSVLLLGPPVYDQISKLAQSIPQTLDSLKTSLNQTEMGKAFLSGWTKYSETLFKSDKTVDFLAVAFSSAVGIVGDALLIFVLGIYLGSSHALYVDSLLRLFPPDKRERARHISRKLSQGLWNWILGRILVMIAVGVVTSIGLWIAGIQPAFALGLITGLLAFIPYLGAFVAFVPVVLAATAESPSLAIYAGIIYTGLHVLEGYVLTPFIQQRVVSIPPAFLIVMQLLMLILFGPLSVFLATPLGVVAVILIQTVYIEDYLGERVPVLGEK